MATPGKPFFKIYGFIIAYKIYSGIVFLLSATALECIRRITPCLKSINQYKRTALDI